MIKTALMIIIFAQAHTHTHIMAITNVIVIIDIVILSLCLLLHTHTHTFTWTTTETTVIIERGTVRGRKDCLTTSHSLQASLPSFLPPPFLVYSSSSSSSLHNESGITWKKHRKLDWIAREGMAGKDGPGFGAFMTSLPRPGTPWWRHEPGSKCSL